MMPDLLTADYYCGVRMVCDETLAGMLLRRLPDIGQRIDADLAERLWKPAG